MLLISSSLKSFFKEMYNYKVIKLVYLGNFKLKSGELVILDPCSTEIKQKIKAYNYPWRCWVKYDCTYVSEIVLTVQNVPIEFSHMDYVEVPVDSGQLCVCDAEVFRSDKFVEHPLFDFKDENKDFTDWYRMCCNRTMETKTGAGLIPHGIVTSTGAGDGTYTARVYFDIWGKVYKITINFLEDE